MRREQLAVLIETDAAQPVGEARHLTPPWARTVARGRGPRNARGAGNRYGPTLTPFQNATRPLICLAASLGSG